VRKFIRILHISHPITPRLKGISYTHPSPDKVSPLLKVINPLIISIKRVPLEMRFEIVLKIMPIILFASIVLVSLTKIDESVNHGSSVFLKVL
jgi:hypothetical protein